MYSLKNHLTKDKNGQPVKKYKVDKRYLWIFKPDTDKYTIAFPRLPGVSIDDLIRRYQRAIRAD